MSRVKLAVGGHEVEVDADVDFDKIVGKALYLFERTSAEAKSLHIGFDTASLVTEVVKREGDSDGLRAP